MRTQTLSHFFLLVLVAPALAQGDYGAQFLGSGTVINDMNELGEVVGWTVAGNVQAFIGGPERPYQFLPLPAGYSSAWAQGINDDSVVVGSVAAGGFPEFGEAAAWYPDGAGSWTVQLLGALPGQTQSVAYDVNNRGDIVGSSLFPGFGGGPTVWFNSPSGLLDIGSLGAPSSPKQINDEGVVVGINGGLFDIDTLTASPLPTLAADMTGFQGWAISDVGGLAGKALHGSQISATRWTAAGDWQSLSVKFGQSASVQAFDINDSGLVYAEIPTPAAYVPGIGVQLLTSLLVPAQQGKWSFFTNLGGAANDAGQIAATGSGPSGQSGVVLLTPVGDLFTDLGGAVAGANGVPKLRGLSGLEAGDPVTVTLDHGLAGASGALLIGASQLSLPFAGGTLVPDPDLVVPLVVGANQSHVYSATWPAGIPSGVSIWLQEWFLDPGAVQGLSASNALQGTTP
ncbi:hypothetical protein [Engelhardtia mirabilis]|uniref:Uncharacterized protein n=1 Tax=Engelhardtia mirabilis TaxID=2528011 RepID=A0A518BMH2_9BACT|nr:hypothetical protein Pla133_32590 [Planctomycetes bacterium Pla133]QDV02491.1 hypothetical protein Pla86_32580 [Planctomycetes bacterium Pla86]